MTTNEKLEAFKNHLQAEQIRGLIARDVACDANRRNAECHVHMGSKYARVDVGNSGKYMVELTTGRIYGIKAYGQIHKGHYYGTLDTISKFDWSNYYARPLVFGRVCTTMTQAETEAYVAYENL